MDNVALLAAQPADLQSVFDLLRANALPTDGVEPFFENFIIAKQGDEVVGAAGFELHGDHALLRSVVVSERMRGTGLGERLVSRIIDEARTQAKTMYLLTTTAERYFPRFGFASTTRSEAPASLNASDEFTHACPASAHVMYRDL